MRVKLAKAQQRSIEALVRNWRWDDDVIEELADELYRYKVAAYLETIEDLAELHGVEPPRELPDGILDQLQAEAEDAAERMAATYNRDVEAFIRRNGERDLHDLRDMIEDWAEDRAGTQAQLSAVHEVYGPHSDATAAFYRLAELSPMFDFGGHGDQAPVCELCAALWEGSPWALDVVIAVGTPHHGCRQSWHPTDVLDVPEGLDFGELMPAGISGGQTLLERHGNLAAAAAWVAAQESAQMGADPGAE